MHYVRKISLGVLFIAVSIGLSLMLIHGRQQRPRSNPPAPPSSGPVNLLDLTAITRDADLIAVGRIVTISDDAQTEQRAAGHEKVAYLQIDRLIKGGDVTSNVRFHFLAPEFPTGNAGTSFSQYGLFFLRNSGAQDYVLVDATYPSLAAVANKPLVSTTATEFELVVAEVSQVVQSPEANPDDRVRAIWALEYVKTRSAVEALRQAAKGSNASVRSHAMASLFRHNDITFLDQAVDAILNPSADTKNVVGGLSDSIRAGVTDARAVPALTRLLDAQNAEDRRNAAETLTRTGSAARPALIKALDDSDQRVRYAAVTGLATISGETDGMPSLEFFQQNEQHYLNHWRERTKKNN